MTMLGPFYQEATSPAPDKNQDTPQVCPAPVSRHDVSTKARDRGLIFPILSASPFLGDARPSPLQITLSFFSKEGITRTESRALEF